MSQDFPLGTSSKAQPGYTGLYFARTNWKIKSAKEVLIGSMKLGSYMLIRSLPHKSKLVCEQPPETTHMMHIWAAKSVAGISIILSEIIIKHLHLILI